MLLKDFLTVKIPTKYTYLAHIFKVKMFISNKFANKFEHNKDSTAKCKHRVPNGLSIYSAHTDELHHKLPQNKLLPKKTDNTIMISYGY